MGDTRHPCVFISYRHSEASGTADADAFNDRHIAWVEQFARDLGTLGVEPVIDARLRHLFGGMFNSDPKTEPAIANLALASIAACHAFVPIITPGWVERIGYGTFEAQRTWQDGYVFDEWQQACAMAKAGQIEILPVFRAGGLENALNLPFVRRAGIVFAFEDDAPYEQNIELLADYLHHQRAVKVPAIDMPVRDWLIEFLRK